MQIWSYLYELQQWLVSERATDGRVCVCVWLLLGKCTQCVCVWSSAVKCYSRWPFRWCRGGITVTVWQNRPQPPCNGWALSRWTPFLPLPLPLHPRCPLFHRDLQPCGRLSWLFLTQCLWRMFCCLPLLTGTLCILHCALSCCLCQPWLFIIAEYEKKLERSKGVYSYDPTIWVCLGQIYHYIFMK